jgi:uncharacterized membrane protein
MSAWLYCISTQLFEIPNPTAVKLLRLGIPLISVDIFGSRFALVRSFNVTPCSLC